MFMSATVAVAVVGCGSTSATPSVAKPHHGVITGMAQQCSGPPGQPAHPVTVILYRDNRIVIQQNGLGSHTYRLLVPPGEYEVTTD
jgi:hypothetical protein